MHARLSTVSVLIGALSLVPLSASALSNRVFLGLNGNNAADCSNPATPCATFAGAMAQVNSGGEIVIEASGGYGPLVITQAITINSAAGVVGYSGTTVTVNAPGANVVLRGLTIDSSGLNGTGIHVTAVGSLHVEDCRISNFILFGITMPTDGGKLFLKNTQITLTQIGVEISNSSGAVTAQIEDCRLDDNDVGFRAHSSSPGRSNTTAIRTSADGNTSTGWLCGAASTGADALQLESCSGSGNGNDGLANNGSTALAIARYSNCVFANNGIYGVDRISTGSIGTRSNSSLTGNGFGSTHGTFFAFGGE